MSCNVFCVKLPEEITAKRRASFLAMATTPVISQNYLKIDG
jgi:hypothetical protein